MRVLLAVILLILSASRFVAPIQAADATDKLSEYMDATVEVDRFSGSVLVAKGDNVLLAKGYGFANLEHQVANTPDTKFRLGSITKQFTATAILILQDRGQLKVEDPINKYIDNPSSAWDGITIHHLLTHTSGIPSFTEDPLYGLMMHKPETVSSMIARFKDKPLDFDVGSKYHYSNSGYFVLGAIIEKASGKSYEAFLKEAIFDPLGMQDTGYDRYQEVLPNRASGYERRAEKLINAPYLDMSQPYAAGALYSTVRDLYRWDRALKEGKPLSKEATTTMFTPFKNNYAYGWVVGEVEGHKFVSHAGGINGFATDFVRYVDDDLCVVVLSNVLPYSPPKTSQRLARIARGESVSPPKVRTVVKVDPSLYDEYVGDYELRPELILTITRDGDRLMTQATGQGKIEIFPESETEFFAKVMDAQLRFVKEDGKVTHVLVEQNGVPRKAPRVNKAPAAPPKEGESK